MHILYTYILKYKKKFCHWPLKVRKRKGGNWEYNGTDISWTQLFKATINQRFFALWFFAFAHYKHAAYVLHFHFRVNYSFNNDYRVHSLYSVIHEK